MTVDVVTSLEDLAPLSARWDELANSDPRYGFFRTSRWYRAWMEHVRPDARPFVIVVRSSAGEIVGLAPLCVVKHHDHWMPMRAISTGGREVVSGDYLDYLAAPGFRRGALTAILDFLWQSRAQWDLLVVGEVFDGEDLHRAVQEFAERRALPLRSQEERPCPYVELPSTFDEYLGTFSNKRRHELRRQMRVLLEKRGAEIEVVTEPQGVAGGLDTLVALHAGRWQRANQSGNMDRPGFVRFLKDICAAPPAGSEARLYVMRYEGAAVAALLIFGSGPSALLYSMGWDSQSALAQLSPGFILTAWSIRDSIERGARYFDFLRGDEGYKSHFTKSSRRTVTLVVGQSVSAKTYLRLLRLKDSFKHRFPALWQRLIAAPDQRATGSGPSEAIRTEYQPIAR